MAHAPVQAALAMPSVLWVGEGDRRERASPHPCHTHPALLPPSWTQHPLIQKNRRVVLASFLLLLLGLGESPRAPARGSTLLLCGFCIPLGTLPPEEAAGCHHSHFTVEETEALRGADPPSWSLREEIARGWTWYLVQHSKLYL